tara:strand:- start:61 stop:1347 length:1287 start_codon:yes stop_codon:yes gene_type:complete
MKILFINPSSPPVPYGTGLQVHNWGNIQALQLNGHEIFLVMLSTDIQNKKEKIKQAKLENKNLKLCTVVEIPRQQIRSLNSLSLSLIFKEFTESQKAKESYFINNDQSVSRKLEDLIIQSKAELIWYEDFYVALYDNWISRNIPAVYNSHNNQSNLYKQKYLNDNQYGKTLGGRIRRIIIQNRYKQLMKFEFKVQRKCNIMFTGNSDDADLSRSKTINAVLRKVPVIGADNEMLIKRKNYLNSLKKNNHKIKLVHLGALNGSFTSQSLLWFLSDVWKVFLEKINIIDIELHIIGGGQPSDELLKQINQPNIVYRGYVDNIWIELIDAFAMLIPGQIFTGVRIRMPVSFSMMVPVIGNKISFQGMSDAKDRESVLYAENPSQYLEAIKALYDNYSFYKKICQNSKEIYDKNYSIDAASADIKRAFSSFV